MIGMSFNVVFNRDEGREKEIMLDRDRSFYINKSLLSEVQLKPVTVFISTIVNGIEVQKYESNATLNE